MKTDFCLLDHLAAMRVGELETLILLIEGFHALTLIVLKLKGFMLCYVMLCYVILLPV